MKRFITRFTFVISFMTAAVIAAQASCPTNAATVIEVCNAASGNGTIRAYFYDGDPALSYYLFSLTTGEYVSDPLGPVTVDTTLPLPSGAKAAVEFGLVPNGDYIIRVNCSPSGTVNIGGIGINVNSANALTAGVTIDPDCNPLTGAGNADGAITLSISGGTAPYDITWPTAATPIPSSVANTPGDYTFPNLDGGLYTVEITDDGNCVFTEDISVPLATIPSAGPDQTVCGFSATLNGNAPGPNETGTWTGPAGVTFSPDAKTPNAVADNLASGANTLTWTITDINGVCPGQSDQVDITADDLPTVEAGPAQAICSGNSALLAGSIGGTATSASWTTSGDGTFDDATSVTATYSPGSADIAAGTVTLTLTTNDPAGPCVSVNDSLVITIDETATVDAGAAQTICSNGTATLAGTLGGSATSATWTTSGDGGFEDPTSVTAVYTPGAADSAATTVTLTLTTNDPAGPCGPATDTVVITIDAASTADAGASQTVCSGSSVTLAGAFAGSASSATWTTSGDGTFDDATSLTAIYTPGSADITAGNVTLTLTTDDPSGPCGPASDNVVITIDQPATVEAGPAQTICSNGSATLAGSLGGAASSATWTTSGDGTFDDPASLTATYTPGVADSTSGTVTLTLTTNDPAGPCGPVNDSLILTIDPTATADAGAPQTICSGSTIALSGSFGGTATSATWTTAGDGTFDDPTSLTAVYTPGTADRTGGTVTLTLTTNDPSGACVSSSDDVVITIDAGATVDAGPAQTICSDATATLAGSIGGAASSATWTTSGDGTFNDVNSLTAIYTPGAGDIGDGTVTLTLTTDDPSGPCVPSSDNVVITLQPPATADAGAPQTVCSGNPVTLAGSISGSATSASWTTAGDGTFDDATSLAAVYTPGSADAIAGSVTLTLTTDDPFGACGPVSDDVTITINGGATADAGPAQTICSDGAATLAGSVGGSATTGSWTTSGDGSFDNPASLSAVYTPGAADLASGSVTLTLTTNDPAGPCGPVNDTVVITIDPVTTADAGPAQTICEGNTVTLAGTIGGTATTATWSTSGDGSFDDATSLTAIYTPGAGDIGGGTVTLTLTTEDPAGPCGSASDDVMITLEPPATAEAGNAQSICSGGTATLSGSSVGGSAATGAWSIVSQPAGGDGVLSDLSQTVTPSTVTFTAMVAGDYTLRLTTDDPAGACGPATDEVVISVISSATVDAGADQIICESGTATLAGAFTGSTGITWTTSGDGSFDDPSKADAVYTPGPNDISNAIVTLIITTAGPCAPVSDDMVITVNPDAIVDAGTAQTICSTASIVLNGSFGGSATGLLWSTSGDGSFDDNTDVNASYTPGANDKTNGSVTLTATATGSCSGVSDDVVITINPAAAVDAGFDQTVCLGLTVPLDGTLSGSATTVTWSTSGDGSFSNINDIDAIYTPGASDQSTGTVTLTATTNNPAGPCPAGSDAVLITIVAIPGDQTTPGSETWIGYVYDDEGDPTPIPGKIDFDNSKYRGFIGSAEIDNMSSSSSYNAGTDEFDMDLGLAVPVQGPDVCGSYLNYFSVRYKMSKTMAAGVYRFTMGADDGVRLLIDGVNVLPASAFDFQSYTTYTSDPVCLSAGVHAFEIHYFDNTAYSRLSFAFEEVPDLVTTSPVTVCINSAAPVLSASSPDADVVDFNWYKGGVLVFSGASYTPAATELDMTATGTTTFQVRAVYACGETEPTDVVVEVVNAATLVINPETICESAGVVDLTTLVAESPAGGTFAFSGHPNITGNNFDPTGLAGTTVSITVDYTVGTCTAPQGTVDLTITNSATTTVPASAVAACESGPDVDLITLVSASPAGGTFTFSGTQVTGSYFDPSGLSGLQTITVDYTISGCVALQTTFQMDVVNVASITVNNTSACEDGAPVNLLNFVAGSPSGGTFSFNGSGVTGNTFYPAGLSGTISIDVDYAANGCSASEILQVTVLSSSDPLCSGGTCSSVVIVPKPDPATCTNSDGRIVFSIKPFTPAVNNTGVRITLDGTSSTNLSISRTIYNDTVFNAIPVGTYNYSIEYGDPSCIKTGQVTVDQSGTVAAPIASNITSPVCYGSATATMTLDVPGETGNVLEWSLDAGLTDPFKPFTAGTQIGGIPAGPAPSYEHVISVRRNSSDPCYAATSVVVPESMQNISANFNVESATCNGNDGAITDIVSSGGSGAPYVFSLNGGETFQTETSFSGLSGGTYTLRVKDASGCENDFNAAVTFPGFINSAITKTNADCSNNGFSGSISVAISDPGTFEVALSPDQFNEPSSDQYVAYFNPSVTFNGLQRGEYFIYVRSNSTACPTRSAPINIFGVYAINFDLEPDCNNNQLSVALTNVTGDPAGSQLEIQLYKKLSTDPPEVIYQPFPADGEIYLEYNQHSFLRTPGEYRIRIIQTQSEIACNLSSDLVDFIVPAALSAQVTFVEESYPDIPSGKLHIAGFSGGLNPYQVRIELDSASSFSLPEFDSGFEEVPLNQDQQFEMTYSRIPPGRYSVEVTDSVGCSIELIARVPLDGDIFIPNVFTPNDDGSNDVFFIRNLPPAPSVNELIISNRWGKEVFVSKNYQNDWKGEGASDGLYFYRLQLQDKDAVTGWIEIIRGPKP
jgi:gliding motility-associated-like protein